MIVHVRSIYSLMSVIRAEIDGAIGSFEISLDDSDTRRRANHLIEPITLDDLMAPPSDGSIIATAWKAFLDHRSEIPDDEAWDRAVLLVLAIFRAAFDLRRSWSKTLGQHLSKISTLSGRPLTLGGSYFETLRSMAAREFHFGRRGTITASKVAALEACVRDFNFLVTRDRASATPHVRRRYLGMRGVALMMIARSQTRSELYIRAIEDLEQTERLGDTSPQRVEYLVEAYLHRYDETGDPALLELAGNALDGIRRRDLQSRALSSLAGNVATARGVRLVDSGDIASATDHFASAVRSYDEALDLAPHHAHSEPYIRINRAAALIRLSYGMPDPADEEAVLTKAIDDLRRVEVEGGGGFPNLWLPSALVSRAKLLQRRGETNAALCDSVEALNRARGAFTTPGAEELARQASLRVADLNLAIAVAENDTERVVQLVEWWLDQSDEAAAPVPTVSHAMRYLISTKIRGWQDHARRVVQWLNRAALHEKHSASARRFALGHAATLALLTAKASDDVALFGEAYELYVAALDAAEAPAAPELYSHASEAALRLAKHEIAQNRDAAAVLLLQDSISFMERAFERHVAGEQFSDKTPLVVVHSRAGEAYTRLHGLTGDDASAAAAIEHFSIARDLGNATPQLIGLLGDVYFRRGRARQNVDDLRLAISMKTEARERATSNDIASWRENLSVTANAALQIWTISRSSDDLTRAILAAREAAKEAPTWAWPIMQLVDASRAPVEDRVAARSKVGDVATDELVRLTLDGDAAQLTAIACRVALENRVGFALDQNFSGRSKVYTIADPHRLLSTTLIVKETPRENASREIATIASFRQYLADTHAPTWMRLPEPLTIIGGPGVTSYVMRREAGAELGAIVLRQRRSGLDAISLLERAVRFLARFHAWRGVRTEAPVAAMLREPLRQALRKLARTSGFSPVESAKVGDHLRAACAFALPTVPKKDAHGENWLVSPGGTVVMLDLEAKDSERLPIIYEVAQLIEDQGLLPPDVVGWGARRELVNVYLDELEHVGALPRTALSFEWAYSVFALIRAVTSIPSTDRRTISRSSESSVVRARAHRADHYRALIETIRNRAAGSHLGDAASIIALWLADETDAN